MITVECPCNRRRHTPCNITCRADFNDETGFTPQPQARSLYTADESLTP